MVTKYKCPECKGTSDSYLCENPSCPNMPCCGYPVEYCDCERKRKIAIYEKGKKSLFRLFILFIFIVTFVLFLVLFALNLTEGRYIPMIISAVFSIAMLYAIQIALYHFYGK